MPDFLPSRLLHGGDYNPEQWPETTWPEDVRLMREANVNVVSLGVFSWAVLEPREGEFDFGGMDRILDLLHAGGIQVILATPTAAHPAWLSEKYPEVLRTGHDRVRHDHRERVNYCLTSPVYRAKCAEIAGRLAQRYGNHPAVILWHVSNEYHGDCHCELCQDAFRQWLQQRYGSLEVLNQRWGNRVWSHNYSTWSQIRSPRPWPDGEWSILALGLDWRRFVTEQTLGCLRSEIAELRRVTPDLPLTTNMHETFLGMMDWQRFAAEVDVISWDNYPDAWMASGDWRDAAAVAFEHDFYRALKRQPYLMIESNPASPRGKLQKRPGRQRLISLQAVAHGADMVGYFQWRNCRSGVEKFHGGVIDHDGSSRTRVFGDVSRLGRDLEPLSALCGTLPDAQVGIICDEEVRWAVEFSTTARSGGAGYVDACRHHHLPLWQQSIATDVISSTADFAPYRILIAPILYMLRPGVAERLEAFVEAGGILVTGYWSGYVDECDLAFTGGFPGPLRSLAGLWSEELDRISGVNGEVHTMRMVEGNPLGIEGEFQLEHFCDVCVLEGAEPLSSYGEDFYAGRAALTRHARGRGMVYYFASAPEEKFMDQFYRRITDDAQISSAWTGDLPVGVSVQTRRSAEDVFLFLGNYTALAQNLTVTEEGLVEMPDGRPVATSLALAPWEVKVLRRK